MKEMILTKKKIEEICVDLGSQLTDALSEEEKPPVFVCIMNGGLNFYAELLKNVKIDLVTDYVQTASFSGLHQADEVKITKELSVDVKDRTVVLVDDCVDSGKSTEKLIEYIEPMGPKTILICCMIDKVSYRKTKIEPDFAGYTLVGKKFLLGFGLDYKGIARNYPYVCVPDEEEIAHLEKLSEL